MNTTHRPAPRQARRRPTAWYRTALLAVILAAVAIGSAGATGPGTMARAPELGGLGTLHLPVSTRNPRAQAFFDQGLRLLYAFNHTESRRAFEEAARLDERLAMAYWGQAMTLAVNLNAPMSAENGRLAYEAARRGQALAKSATPVERALLAALVTRFAADGAAPRPPLDRAYADAMANAAARFPDHPDVQVLAADARMNTMAWDYWQPDGSFKPGAEAIRQSLERVIARHPDHPGAHHYYIHLVEGSRQPELAEASADRLGTLMPSAGHMVHMPAHIYLRVGRYADAAEANVRAIAADEDYLAQCQAQGLYPLAYYPHNLHFLWAAVTFEGRSAAAIAAAREVADLAPADAPCARRDPAGGRPGGRRGNRLPAGPRAVPRERLVALRIAAGAPRPGARGRSDRRRPALHARLGAGGHRAHVIAGDDQRRPAASSHCRACGSDDTR